MAKQISLTQGKVALVSDHQYERVSQFKWHAALVHGHWYAKRTEGKKTIMLHRFILGATNPDVEIDHIDGDGLNCQDENMRACSHAENTRNKRIPTNNTTGFKGVAWNRNKFVASIRLSGKQITVGRFSDPIEAARAYDTAAKEHFGQFANTNF